MIGVEDLDLVEGARNGDLDAFTVLVEKYQARIYRLAFRIVKNVADSQDITQETFIQAFRGLETFREDAAFFTWLYRIALNNALNCRIRQRQFDGRFESADEDRRVAIESVRPICLRDTPPDHLESKQALEMVERVLEEMPGKFSEALMMLVLDGLSCSEISVRSEVSPNTVRTRVFRAREFLAKRMPDFQTTARGAL